MTKLLFLFISVLAQSAWSQQNCKSLIDSKIKQIPGINKTNTETINRSLASMNAAKDGIDSIISKIALSNDEKEENFMNRFKRVIANANESKFREDLGTLLNFAPSQKDSMVSMDSKESLEKIAILARERYLEDRKYLVDSGYDVSKNLEVDPRITDRFRTFYRKTIFRKYFSKNNLLKLKVEEFEKNYPFESAGIEHLQRENIDFDSMKIIGGAGKKNVTLLNKGNSVVAIITRDGDKVSLTQVSADSCKPFAALYMHPNETYKYIGGSTCNKLKDASRLSLLTIVAANKVLGYEKFEAFLDSNGTYLTTYPSRKDYDTLVKLCKSVPQGWENGYAIRPVGSTNTSGQSGSTAK